MPFQPVLIKTIDDGLGNPWIRCMRFETNGDVNWLSSIDTNSYQGTLRFNEFKISNGVVQQFSLQSYSYTIQTLTDNKINISYGNGATIQITGAGTNSGGNNTNGGKFTALGGNLVDTIYVEYDNTIDDQNGNLNDLKAQIETALAGSSQEADANQSLAVSQIASAAGQAIIQRNAGNELGRPWIKQINFAGLNLLETAISLDASIPSDNFFGQIQMVIIKLLKL